MGGRGKGRDGGGGKGGGRGGGGGGGSKVGFIKPADPSFLRRLKEQYGYKASHFTVNFIFAVSVCRSIADPGFISS